MESALPLFRPIDLLCMALLLGLGMAPATAADLTGTRQLLLHQRQHPPQAVVWSM